MGFLIIPISQSLNLQGVLLVVGHFFGPTEAAILATARTLARLVETAINMVYNLAFEEVGYAAGANDSQRSQAHPDCLDLCVGGILGLGCILLSADGRTYALRGLDSWQDPA